MVEVSSVNYDNIQTELLAYADKLMSEKDSIKVTLDDTEKERKIHYEMRGDNPLIVHYYKAEGVTMD